jgi:hypothetical protein
MNMTQIKAKEKIYLKRFGELTKEDIGQGYSDTRDNTFSYVIRGKKEAVTHREVSKISELYDSYTFI